MDTRDRSKQESAGNGHGKNGNGHGTAARAEGLGARAEPAGVAGQPHGVVGFFDRAVERLREVGRRARARSRGRDYREEQQRGREASGTYMPGGGTMGNPLWSGMRSRYEQDYPQGYGGRREREGGRAGHGWYEGDPYWQPTFRPGEDPNRVYASREPGRVWGAPDERREHWQGRAVDPAREGLNEEIRSFPRRPGEGAPSGQRFVEDFAGEREGYEREHVRGREYTRGRDEWSYGARDESDRYERTGYGARWEDEARGERPQGRGWGGPERGPWEDRDRERRFGRTGLGYEGPGRGEYREEARYGADDYDRRPEQYDSRTERHPDQQIDTRERRGSEWDRGYRGRR